jgi:hypothetical protein
MTDTISLLIVVLYIGYYVIRRSWQAWIDHEQAKRLSEIARLDIDRARMEAAMQVQAPRAAGIRHRSIS